MIELTFLTGLLLGTLIGGAFCVRYLRREIAALAESKRTESYWVRTRVFDARGEKQIAEMLLNHATLKHSYSGYAEAAGS